MKKKNIVSYIITIFWMILIFTMSSFDATKSSNQSNFIVNIISHILNINNISLLSIIIRKLAHFTEYLILGILISNTINKTHKKYLLALIICFLYAVSDEIHQIYVPGRSCQITDMIIDTTGSLTGIFLYKLIIKIKRSSK